MELGALSLRIEELGLENVLAALRATEDGGKKAAQVEKLLNKEIAESNKLFALQARVADVANKGIVAGVRQAALAQSQYLQKLGASEIQQLQHARSIQVFQTRVERADQVKKAFGQTLTTNTGKLSAFSTRAITGFNAAAFALSSFTAGGQAGFRTLASAAAGFASFFGPGGAIAAIAISGGLAITDYFTRARKEIDDTKEAALKAAAEIEALRRKGDSPTLVERFQETEVSLKLQREELAKLNKELEKADKIIETARAIDWPFPDIGLTSVVARAGLSEETKQRMARREEIQRTIPLLEKDLELTRKAVQAAQSQGGTKAIPFPTITATKPKTKEELDKEQAARIAALSTLHSLNLVTGRDLVELAKLERELAAELARGNVTLERRAQIEKLRATIRESSLQVPPISGLVSGRPQPVRSFDGAAIQAAIRNAPTPDSRVINPRLEELEQQLAAGLAGAIAGGITQGFADGLARGGLEEGFKGMLASVSAGFGSLFIQIGQQAILGSKLIGGISKALSTMNPVAAFAAAVALMALGSSLGGRRGGRGGGTGGGGFASSGNNTVPLSIRRLIVDPNTVQRSMVPLSTSGLAEPLNLFGDMRPLVTNEPAGERWLAARVNNANSRKGR